jgi:hypothetical protein
MKVWLSRTVAWPLVLVGLAVIGLQYGVAGAVRETFRRIPPALGDRIFLVAAPCVEVIVDVLLVAWIARAMARGSGFVRLTGLFFLWQGAKTAFTFLCVAATFSYFPFPPWL